MGARWSEWHPAPRARAARRPSARGTSEAFEVRHADTRAPPSRGRHRAARPRRSPPARGAVRDRPPPRSRATRARTERRGAAPASDRVPCASRAARRRRSRRRPRGSSSSWMSRRPSSSRRSSHRRTEARCASLGGRAGCEPPRPPTVRRAFDRAPHARRRGRALAPSRTGAVSPAERRTARRSACAAPETRGGRTGRTPRLPRCRCN